MVNVRDIGALDKLEFNIETIYEEYNEQIRLSIQEIDIKLEEIEAELIVSVAMLDVAKAHLLYCETQLANAIASADPMAITMASMEAEKAHHNFLKMQERVELVTNARNYAIQLREYVSNIYHHHFSLFESNKYNLKYRLSNATIALEKYLFSEHSNITQDEMKKLSSNRYQYKLYQHIRGKISKQELNKYYEEKLESKKNNFRTSNYAQAENISYSKYNLPEFKSNFECNIPPENYGDTRSRHFAIANKQLKKKIEEDEQFREQFDLRELEQIRNGITPDGYTWHHDGNPPVGRMQLVITEIHDKIRHDGGYSLWTDRKDQ